MDIKDMTMYKKIIDLDLAELSKIELSDSLFEKPKNLAILDIVLCSEFVKCTMLRDTSKLLLLVKALVLSNSYMLQTKFDGVDEYKFRWRLLSELCSEYLR